MTIKDQERWDSKYRDAVDTADGELLAPSAFAHVQELFPTTGTALDVACGRGGASLWLAQRGLSVVGCDVSTVAVAHARARSVEHDLASSCEFVVADLDDGLPLRDPVDVVLCHMFRDRSLDQPMIDLLGSGGLLAIACLSEVDAQPGRFRATAGELVRSFGHLDVLDQGEADGVAWLVAKAGPPAEL